MGLFSDLFGSGYQDAAKAQTQALNTAYKTATPFYDTARRNITDYGGAALAPYTDVFGTGKTGVGAYSTAVGLGGDPTATLNALRATPGYQFTLGEGEQAVDRGAAARSGGSLYSGNTLTAEDKYAQGLADQTYRNYVSNLTPYLGLFTGGASGVSGVNTGIGGNIAGINLNQGNLGYNTQVGIGNAQAAADTASQNAFNSFVNGLVQAGGQVLGYAASGGMKKG